jgi:phenylpropionate dioxygenase-like ring-hydroxylating dioxygenase large terminal subunit
MLSAELNKRVTETGSGTPCGELMRQFWQPAALSEELAGERPVVGLRLLGQDLVLFRDQDDRLGLIGRHCCHRGADLAFGRLEDGGLRCPFHGWLFDVTGVCLEQPAEPVDSSFHRKVRQPSYPCIEANGVIFAYLGTGEPPPPPAMDCFTAPDAYSFAFKGLWECNWLQALEVGIDPAHASYLHRTFVDPEKETYGQQFGARAADTDTAVTEVLRNYATPEIDIEETQFGLRIAALRMLNDSDAHVRITNLVFPNAFVIPMSNEMIITQWHVPIDDNHNYWYAIFTDYRNPVDKKIMRDQRLASCTLPDYRSVRNRDNNWGYDPEEQRTLSYTGMGKDINVHDQWAVESPGAIFDRTQEHLGTTDKAIIANRKLLLRNIAQVTGGERPDAGLDHAGLAAVDTIVPGDNWREDWRRHESIRRSNSPWA